VPRQSRPAGRSPASDRYMETGRLRHPTACSHLLRLSDTESSALPHSGANADKSVCLRSWSAVGMTKDRREALPLRAPKYSRSASCTTSDFLRISFLHTAESARSISAGTVTDRALYLLDLPRSGDSRPFLQITQSCPAGHALVNDEQVSTIGLNSHWHHSSLIFLQDFPPRYRQYVGRQPGQCAASVQQQSSASPLSVLGPERPQVRGLGKPRLGVGLDFYR
jgi:hypothetical protein